MGILPLERRVPHPHPLRCQIRCGGSGGHGSGGSGFLGSFLCEKLLELGNEVICLDNFYTGSKRNILHLLDNHRFELIRHDVTFPLYVEVDEIYNLACPASPIHYQRDPVQTVKTCVHGAIHGALVR